MDNEQLICDFCIKFSNEINLNQRHSVFDNVLWENNDFIIVPTRGCIVEGYLLIIPKHHYYGMASLPQDKIADLTKIKNQVRQYLTNHFTAPIFFEHGPICRTTNRAGSCLDHAHLHCVPVQHDFLKLLRNSHQLKALDNFEELAMESTMNRSYMYYENQGGLKFVFSDINVPSQYMRRLIAKTIGIPNKWDWAVFPFEKHAQSTIKTLESNFSIALI